jgi:hypothetical protein
VAAFMEERAFSNGKKEWFESLNASWNIKEREFSFLGGFI